MSGLFFVLPAEAPRLPSRVVISVDQMGVADLIRIFSRLADARMSTVQLSTEGFEGVNLTDVLFRRATASRAELQGSQVMVGAGENRFRRYAELIEALKEKSQGHQYLDTELPNIDIIVSLAEYPPRFIERLRSETSGMH